MNGLCERLHSPFFMPLSGISGQRTKNGECPEEKSQKFWAESEKRGMPRRKESKVLGRE